MAINRVKNRQKSDNTQEASNAINIMTNKEIRESSTKFNYSALVNISDKDKEKLQSIEKELLYYGKNLGEIAWNIGKALNEAKEIFEVEDDKSFMGWYSNLGLTKDQVSVFSGRYRLSLEHPQAKERILSLSDVAIKETINRKTPEIIKEKVFSGEITTAKQIKDARKETSNIVSDIEEIQVISNLNSFNTLFEEISAVLDEKIHKITENGGSDYKNLEKFREIKKILDSIEV